MSDQYKRTDRSDLSGMDPNQLADYLRPHYKTDEDLSVDNVKLAFGPWLIFLAVVGGLGLVVFGLIALF